jgi:hypothetical protein
MYKNTIFTTEELNINSLDIKYKNLINLHYSKVLKYLITFNAALAPSPAAIIA